MDYGSLLFGQTLMISHALDFLLFTIPYSSFSYLHLSLLLKNLYDRLFTWIVATLNNVIHVERDVTRYGAGSVIGVLDIYGFEIFQDNRYCLCGL